MECVAVCGLMQLLMTYLVVYMVMSPTSEVVHSDSRLLLSLQDPTGPKMEARLVFYLRGIHKLNNKVRVFSTSTSELRCLLDGESNRGRGS